MCERSTQKGAAFTVVRDFRAQERSQKRHGSPARRKPVRRTRKLTMNAEELQNERVEVEREPMSANPQFSYGLSQECARERRMQDELQQGIPYQFRDCELELESPFCSSTRKYSQEVREERLPSPTRDDFTIW